LCNSKQVYSIYAMFRCLKVVCFVLFFISSRAWSLTAQTTQDMNFGTYIQTATNASGVLAHNSSVGNLSGLVVGSTSSNTNATIRLEGSGQQEYVDVAMQTSSVVLSGAGGCTMRAQYFTFPSSQISLETTHNLNIGATLSISGGFCQEGTYTGTATVELTGTDRVTANFTIRVTIEAPLDIQNIKPMYFGNILSPDTATTITLAPDGSYTTSGSAVFVDPVLEAGEFTVTGVGQRLIYITLPSSTTLSQSNGAATMTVDNFTSSPSGSFTMSGTGTGQTRNITVGARLRINAGQASGSYSGAYPIIVSY